MRGRTVQISGQRHKPAAGNPVFKIFRIVIGKTCNVGVIITRIRRIVQNERIGAVDRKLSPAPKLFIILRFIHIVQLLSVSAVVIGQFVGDFVYGFRAISARRQRCARKTCRQQQCNRLQFFHSFLLNLSLRYIRNTLPRKSLSLDYSLFLSSADVNPLDKVFLHAYVKKQQGYDGNERRSALCVSVSAAFP